MKSNPKILNHLSLSIPRRAQRGFSLIETATTMAILAIGVLGLSTIVSISIRDDKAMQASLVRTNLSATLRAALTNRKSLKNTILNNPEMKAVITGSSADYAVVGGRVYSDNRPYGIEIYDSENRVLAGKAADASGNPEAPAYYTTGGSRCTTPGVGSCLLSVTAALHVQGEADWDSVDHMKPVLYYPDWHPTYKPDFLMVVYSIETLSNGSSTIQKKRLAGSVFISMEDVEGLLP